MTSTSIAILTVGAVVVLFALAIAWVALRRLSAPPPSASPDLQIQQQILHLSQRLEEAVREITGKTDEKLAFGTKALTDLVLTSQGTVSKQLADQAQTVGQAVGTLQQRLGEVGAQIRGLSEMGQDLRRLQDILGAPKLRGVLGERLLSGVLELFLPAGSFTLQHPFRGGEKVDAALQLPGGLVPVDAKFPVSNFERVLGAQGEDEARRARRAFREDVRRHGADIAAKYIRPAEGTFDFALMYVPAENVYYEAFVSGSDREEGGDLWRELVESRVFPVSPNTFALYLATIVQGLRGMRVADEARRIVAALSALQRDVESLRETFDLACKHLINASRNFEDARTRLGRLDARLRQVDAEGESGPSPT
jgi:DNA recombination protein RmuC